MTRGRVAAIVITGAVAFGAAVSMQSGAGGGLTKIWTSGTILGGSGTPSAPLTFTLTKSSEVTGTGSSGSGLTHTVQLDGGWYGDGTDGDVTISVDTTLSRDMHYDHLTIDSGKFLYTRGFRVFAKSSIVLNGTIEDCDTKDATGAGHAAGCSTGNVLPAGQVSVCGGCGDKQPVEMTGTSGGRGGGNGTAACTCAAGQALTATAGNYYSLRYAISAIASSSTAPSNGHTTGAPGINGSSAAGAGSCTNSATGGGGAGGWMVVGSPVFTGSGSISARGGNGKASAASTTATTQGGGGGGTGGFIVLVYSSGTAPTTNIAGGVHGADCGSVSPAASDGSAGYVYTFKIGPQ